MLFSRIGIAVLLVAAGGCAGGQKDAGAGAEVHRIAVLPLNSMLQLSPLMAGADDRMLGQITAYLKLQGRVRRTIGAEQTAALWHASIEQVEADGSPRGFESAMRIFARNLVETDPFDALVVSSLVFREARLIRERAKWDGVVRVVNADVRSDKINVPRETVPQGFRGTIQGVSLHVMVFSPLGEKQFENYGGVDVVHDVSLDEAGRLRSKIRQSVLVNYRYLREAVEVAFEPYFPRPRTGDW